MDQSKRPVSKKKKITLMDPPPKLRDNNRYPCSHRRYKARQKWVTIKVGNRNSKHPMGMHSRG
jgi:hypothetical protein